MSNPATLNDWLSKLEQLHPKEIELGLARVATVFDRLSLALPTVITVAGTNGKGSAIAMLEAAFAQLGLAYGSYTSPHIICFNERIKLNGQNVADQPLIEQFEAIEAVRADIALTYFEYTTLAALMIFAKSQLDVVLLEVGLGGRLDAVNIVDADIAVVTSIALDHQDWLGDSRELIACEKMGISRKNKPVLICEHEPPATIQAYADEIGAIPFFIDQHFGFSQCHDSEGGALEYYLSSGCKLTHAKPETLSTESLLLALQIVDMLGFDVTELDVTALAKTGLMGRCQYIHTQGKTLLLDVSHNPAAVTRLCAYLQQTHAHQTIHICIGVMADKDYLEIIELLAPVINGRWYTVQLDTDRALPAKNLQQTINKQLKVPCQSVANCADAIANINGNELLLICGSFYTVAAGIQSSTHKGLASE